MVQGALSQDEAARKQAMDGWYHKRFMEPALGAVQMKGAPHPAPPPPAQQQPTHQNALEYLLGSWAHALGQN